LLVIKNTIHLLELSGISGKANTANKPNCKVIETADLGISVEIAKDVQWKHCITNPNI